MLGQNLSLTSKRHFCIILFVRKKAMNRICASSRVVLRRLAKAKIAGSIPVSRFLKSSREKYFREVFDFFGKANMIVKDGNILSDIMMSNIL